MKLKSIHRALFLLIVLTSIALINVAYGQGNHECQGGHNCNDAGAAGDTIIGGDEALGIGFGMGDVDIRECLASKSTPVYQWLKENPWCMANGLDARGRHEAAAKVRCQTKTLRKAYPNRVECEAAVLMIAALPPVLPELSENDSDEDEDDGRIEYLQMQISELTAGYERQMQEPPQLIVDPAIQQNIDASKARRTAASKALKGEQ